MAGEIQETSDVTVEEWSAHPSPAIVLQAAKGRLDAAKCDDLGSQDLRDILC